MSKKVEYQHPRAPFNFRRQVLPPLLGVLIMLGVAGFMNGEWISAQLYYRFSKPVSASEMTIVTNVKLDPKAQPELSIPAIKVKAPIVNVASDKEGDIQKGLREGVVRFSSSAEPGQAGNVVIFGHSSGQPLASGNYKFIFTLLNKVQPDQRISVDYKGTRYVYKIVDTNVVLPTDLTVLDQIPSKHMLTLITCSPVGGNSHRLIVRAEQISPEPGKTTNASTIKTEAKPSNQQLTTIPDATGESFWDSVRNLF